jgi:hypothetical protein
MDRSINVHDYAVTDVSDDLEYYPRRGRSPPTPHRTETAGTTMPFSAATIEFLQSNVPLPRISVITPETTPLPDSSNGSEYLNDARDTPDSREALGIPSAEISNGTHSNGNGFSADSSNEFDYVDFATRFAPIASDPMDFISTNASFSQNHEEQATGPSLPTPEFEITDEKALLITDMAPAVDTKDADRRPQRLRHTEYEKEIDIGTKFSATEETRATVAISNPITPSRPTLYPAELTGVGRVHSDSPPHMVEIPPSASLLDDDFTNEMH